MKGNRYRRQAAPVIIWHCGFARERVKGAAHFLKSCLDEGGRIIRDLLLQSQIMEHVEQLRASRGTIPKATEELLAFQC